MSQVAELGLDPGLLVSRLLLLLRNHPPKVVSLWEVSLSCSNTFHGSLVPVRQILNYTHPII